MPTPTAPTVIFLALLLLGGAAEGSAEGGDRSNAYRAMDALERAAQFLAMHKEAVTVDHALGAAIAQGAVEGALGTLRPGLAPLVAQRLVGLHAVLGTVLGDAAAALSPATRRLLQPSLWRVPGRAARAALPSARTLLELRELAVLGSPSEAESGRCIAALLDAGAAGAPCALPVGCVRAETAETEGPAAGYAATHRLLFHHVAGRVGCAGRHVGTRSEIKRLCRRILGEAQDIARARFPPLLRDLFAEQVAVCGLRGFTAFARPEWLDWLLSWQRPAGCFGNYSELQEASKPFENLSGSARLDDPLGNECLSHLTGVATAAVAFNLRVLVQRWLGAD